MPQQAEQQIVREREQAAPVSTWRLLPDLMRKAVEFLALMIGFAALAQRPGAPISLLQEHRQGILVPEGIDPLGDMLRSILDQMDEEAGTEEVDHRASRS